MAFIRKLYFLSFIRLAILAFFLIRIIASCEKDTSQKEDDHLNKILSLESDFINTINTNLHQAYKLADSLKILSANHSVYRRGRAHRLYGLTAMKMGLFDEARLALNTALENQDLGYPNEHIYLMQNLAAFHEFIGQPDSAFLYHNKAVALLEGNPKYPNRGDLYETKALALMELGLFSRAHDSYQEAIRAYEKKGDSLSIIYALSNLGINYQRSIKYDSAVMCYNKALKLADAFNNQRAVYKLQLNKADALRSSNLSDESLELIKISKKSTLDAGDSLTYFGLLNLEILTLSDLNEKVKSQILLLESEKIAQKINTSSAYLGHLETKAQFWLNQDSMSKVLDIILKGIQYYNDNDQKLNQSPAASFISILSRDIKKAIESSQFVSTDYWNLLKKSLDTLWLSYEFDLIDSINKEKIYYHICLQKKSVKNCHKYLESSLELSQYRIEQMTEESNIKVHLIEEIDESNLNNLQNLRKLEIARHKNEKISLYSFFLFLLLLLTSLSSVYIYKANKSLKKNNKFILDQHKKIEEKNSEVQIKLEEKKKLLVRETMYKESFLNLRESFKSLHKSIDPLIRNNPNYKELQEKFKEISLREEESMLLHFTELEGDVIKKVLKINDKLTKNDLKHIAYLKLNLSNKEVANLLGVTVKTVVMGRYRLKKKLGLEMEQSIYSFIQGL